MSAGSWRDVELNSPVGEAVSVRRFGALGDGSQALVPCSYATDKAASPVTITRQTADGEAINRALRYLRSVGGGTLVIPPGLYRIAAYLERIDFPLLVRGSGEGAAVLKAIDGAVTAHGYGIFCVDPDASRARVHVQDLTLDGNCDGVVAHRARPGGEYRAYNLAFYGAGNYSLQRVRSINSPIDCLTTAYRNDAAGSFDAVDCTFDGAYRNTVSCVSGWNQRFANCRFLNGGVPFGGTAPRYCLDVEPDDAADTVKGLLFERCRFEGAAGTTFGVVWADGVLFLACTFMGGGNPLLGNLHACRARLRACDLLSPASRDHYLRHEMTPGGEFAGAGVVELQGCRLDGVGLELSGQKSILDGCHVLNTRRAVVAYSPVTILRGTLLENVGWGDANGGRFGSFSTGSNTTPHKKVKFDGLTIRIDTNSLPAAWTGDSAQRPATLYGIYLDAAVERVVNGLDIEGYHAIPTLWGAAQDADNWRDWGQPSLPPADTVGGTSAADFYRGCRAGGPDWVAEGVAV